MFAPRWISRLAFCFATLSALSAGAQQRPKAPTILNEASIGKSPARFPFRIPQTGPLAIQLEVLLDRAGFSSGIIDGAWGLNAAKAITFFSLPDDSARFKGDSPKTVASIDRTTYERLRAASGSGPIVRWYTISAEDMKGPFAPVPVGIYNQAKLSCLCYSSAAEKLGEKFHTTSKFLAQLNPRAKLSALEAGMKLLVPNVYLDGEAIPQDTAIAVRVIVSKKGYWTQALDANGHIIYHFPSTLGAGYDPSPTGDFKITSVSYDPAFKYQPKLFHEVPDSDPQALLKPGPNSPVGVVWMSLSKPHYGIHGTPSPETIGYANSHGCVRLTNWDALRLSFLVPDGTPVLFR